MIACTFMVVERSVLSVDVAVVGGGQAALAVGYYLAQQGRNFLLLERATSIGASWARRWDSLQLFTPNAYNSLPGLHFPGDRWAYPNKDQVAAYLEEYSIRHQLPIQTDAEVVGLTGQLGDFKLRLFDGSAVKARQVVIATGPFSVPFTPMLSSQVEQSVFQIHSNDYRNPAQLPGTSVLVIGGGNSGFQIAKELAAAGKNVFISAGQRLPTIRQRLLGRDLFWWLSLGRLIEASSSSWLGRRMRANEPVIGLTRRALRKVGIDFRPRAVAASGSAITFEDGSSVGVDAVVWATGFSGDDRWVSIPNALNGDGVIHLERGRTQIKGLHVLGRPWQRSRGSALLGFVQTDAQLLSELLCEEMQEFEATRLAP